jgi:D-alanyl-D-alanine dipeptidase
MEIMNLMMKRKIVSASLVTAALLLFSLTPVSFAAKAVPKDVSFLLGMYYGNASVFLLREEKGILQIVYLSDKENRDFSMGNVFPLKKVRFDSYMLDEEGPMLSAEAPVHFERDAEGNGIVCKIGGKRFTRNFFPGEGNKTFRLEANADYQSLKEAAPKAVMPAKLQQGQAARLVRIRSVVPNVKFDLRYAGANNIFGVSLYDTSEAFMEAETAAALKRAADRLAAQGYGLIVWEGYRPWYVSKLASDLLPKDKKDMMPGPEKGEDRNTGRTVDVSLYDLASGDALKMISDFDEVSVRQFPGFVGGTERQRSLRDMLAGVMKECGFTQGKDEWWHFTLGTAEGWQHLNIPYGQIR